MHRHAGQLLMLLAAHLALVKLVHCKQGSAQPNMSGIEYLLRSIKHLNVYLSRENDTALPMVQFLLRQVIVPIQLSVAGTRTGSALQPHSNQFHRAMTMRSPNLLSILNTYATRKGIFLCITVDQPDQKELQKIASGLWLQKGVFNVFYITPERHFYYNPFARTAVRFGAFLDMKNLPLEHIFANLNGYPVRVYIFDSVYSSVYGNGTTKTITKITGADSMVAKIISEKLNFTMLLQWPDDEFFGARLENGSFDGAIGRLMRYETDVVFTGFFVKNYLTNGIEFSVPIYMDKLCCYVQKAKRIPQSILPLFAVHVDIWWSFFAVGFLSPLFWMVMRRLNLFFNIPQFEASSRLLHSNMRIFMDTWVIWVRVNIVSFPPFNSERVFIAALCLMSVIFGALFESGLATVYIRPLYYKDINTMKELAAADFKIYFKHAAMRDDMFYGSNSSVFRSLNSKLLLVGETEDRLIAIMSKRGHFAAVTRAASLSLNDIHYFITKKIHMIPECPKTYHIAFVFPKHSAYENAINILLLKLIGAGLIDYWIDDMKHKAKISIHNFPDYVAESSESAKVLNLTDLQLAFYALLLGQVLAIVSFLSELAMHRRYYFRSLFGKKINFGNQ